MTYISENTPDAAILVDTAERRAPSVSADVVASTLMLRVYDEVTFHQITEDDDGETHIVFSSHGRFVDVVLPMDRATFAGHVAGLTDTRMDPRMDELRRGIDRPETDGTS